MSDISIPADATADPAPEPESLAAAHALIEDDRKRRMAECLSEIEAALDKHGMTLHIEPARLTLVPKD